MFSPKLNFWILGIQLLVGSSNLHAEGPQPLTFDGIPETKYQFTKPTDFSAAVQSSASALILPLDAPKAYTSLHLQWRLTGDLKTKDAAQEETKAGDDFPLRVGFCLAGKAPLIPFFAPAWVKKIRNTLHHPSDELWYFVIGSKHTPGVQWKSPYTSSIINIATDSTMDEKGWHTVNQKLSLKKRAVCLWLMADGDNTKSNFTVEVKGLEMKE